MSNQGPLCGEFFVSGDEACAEAAIWAGCRFFAGYPITPATEIAERMAERMPEIGGTYIQMEDELASMNAVLGAAWGGAKSMTATSGPGFSLMMENLGLGIMTETPCVLVNVQRGGPSTGLPTLVAQADMMQARWGSHGSYEIIALCPSSPQDFFDLTIEAFNLSEKYRTPVLVMADEAVGHMTERVVIPPVDPARLYPRRKPTMPPEQYRPFGGNGDGIPAMACAGEGYHLHVTGLTHDARGYPVTTNPAVQEQLVHHLVGKIRDNRADIVHIESDGLDGAEVIVVSYGISARIALWPVEMARAEGIKVGWLKLVTVWPFPEDLIRTLAKQTGAFVVPEINYGQIALEVERCAAGNAQTILVPHAGGDVHEPHVILDAIRRASTGRP
jgi:2-oxoglutarate/2-oxoacid ferredoxin oxidoreductase subunit alpha